MTGPALDEDDIVQDALFHAYRTLDFRSMNRVRLRPGLFRIAHNRPIDFLRRREVRRKAEAAAQPIR
jgi:RNA polymerase sigma-70 factor, ECF subfamily